MFEPITDDDIATVAALMNRAYRGSAAQAGWNSEAAYIAGDRTNETLLRAAILANPEALFLKWVEHPNETVLGCVWLQSLDHDSWYLGSLAAEPSRQNEGLGRTLLAAAEALVRAQGGKRIRMTVVNVRSTLIAWYLRRGYRLTGETEPFPYDDDRFGTPLRDDLAFVVLEKDLTSDRASV
ncbi:GNAT family N-acetyltransferase [Sphingomonas nostoxanthinifaciens]|uniref:GNAT family N-acetyltransferase n=1 Tax=Sphingomonas nostoxanthinifaciens TaxID=2872652 RepID=UPI001CC1C33A|nr:GNAT family N-acetyltransferase [Sphingomonas nostoxanthinifaciens]UAK25892.1 GNAT family N-acetyltransferase [Sphingomonas nostoxanthinifaciens]